MSCTSPPTTAHFVCASVPILSHVTPLIGIAASLLVFPELVITVCVPESLRTHAQNEVAAHERGFKEAGVAGLNGRLRVFAIADDLPSSAGFWDKCTSGFSSFHTTFDALLESREVTDCTGHTLAATVPPTLIIADQYAFYLKTRSYPAPIRRLIFVVTAVRSTVMFFDGHMGRVEAEAERVFQDPALSKDRTFANICDELFAHGEPDPTQVIQVPGYPDVHLYELMPQSSGPVILKGLAGALTQAQDFLLASDGLIALTAQFLEPETLAYVRARNPTMDFIPILPKIARPSEQESPDRARVLLFLEGRPVNSVLYVSFGSNFHPSTTSPRNYAALVETLLEDDQPWAFVLTKGSKDVILNESLVDRLEKSEKGIYCDWAPQRECLAHESVGLMLSHGGSGGTFEALQCSVPLLFYPIAVDQPLVSSLFCSPMHNVGLELVQVRTGSGAGDSLPYGKIHGTVDAIKTEIREKLARFWGSTDEAEGFRRRAGELGHKLRHAGEPGGESYEALQRMARYF